MELRLSATPQVEQENSKLEVSLCNLLKPLSQYKKKGKWAWVVTFIEYLPTMQEVIVFPVFQNKQTNKQLKHRKDTTSIVRNREENEHFYIVDRNVY